MHDELKRQLAKIKKLLNLAQSSNPSEASLALSRAQALMKKYGVNLDDVALSEVSATDARVDCLKPPQWLSRLIDAINKAFGTSAVASHYYDGSWNKKGAVKFIGISPNDEIAAYCFDVLYRQLLSHRKAFIASLHNNCKKATKTARADWYCLGWVAEVNAKITPLVVSNDHKTYIAKWKNENLDIETYTPRAAVEDKKTVDSYMKGRIDGAGVSLYAGMAGEESLKLSYAK